MCGIYGCIGVPDKPEFIQEMLQLIKHRGPDDQGYWLNDRVSLGMVRLSIQDISSLGHQPMFSQDGNYVLVYNGEIYNHLDLKAELQLMGCTFISTSDTETLLWALQKWGVTVLPRLKGIFAFCFYDIKEKKVWVVRDQMGVKPLYFSSDNRKFTFSSELKVVIASADHVQIHEEAIFDYLSFLWSPGEQTPVKGISKLLPGYFASIDFSQTELKVSFHQYYQIPYLGKYIFNDEQQAIDELDKRLNEAVKSQLLSDVPVGFFLSGGLDSSVLVAMARKYKNEVLQTFTISRNADLIEEGFTDDYQYAREVSKYLGVNLEVVQSDISIVRDFDNMIWHLDEPQADPAPLHVKNISKRAYEMGYKVLISGSGGDDLFSGYRRHQASQLEQALQWIPNRLIKIIASVSFLINAPLHRRLKKVSNELEKSLPDRLANYFLWLQKDQVYDLFSERAKEQLVAYNSANRLIELLYEIPEEHNWLNRMLYWEQKSFLVDHNLNYTDKMGMAEKVEIRVPYLDVDVVNFAASLLPGLKLNQGETKYILKKVAERYLPRHVIYRSKSGFGAPVRKWIREDMNEMISVRLSDENIIKTGIFDPIRVKKLIDENRAGKIDASYTIWSLLAIDSWVRQFLEGKQIVIETEK